MKTLFVLCLCLVAVVACKTEEKTTKKESKDMAVKEDKKTKEETKTKEEKKAKEESLKQMEMEKRKKEEESKLAEEELKKKNEESDKQKEELARVQENLKKMGLVAIHVELAREGNTFKYKDGRSAQVAREAGRALHRIAEGRRGRDEPAR